MIRVYPSVLQGTLKAEASKAHAQRLLFAASMPATPTLVSNVPPCDDIDVSLDVLRTLGCKFASGAEGEIMVEPFPKTNPVQNLDFNFKDSATTSRLTLALCSALGIQANCTADAGLVRRQQIPLTSRMALRGAKFDSFSFPLTMTGRLEHGDFVFRGDEGSQYVSSILYALPLLPGDSRVTLETPLADPAFVELTTQALEAFGIKIEKTENGYFVPGRQYYSSPGEIRAENDWGLASMWITAAAACSLRGGSVRVTDLPKSSPQQYRDLKPLLSLIAQDFRDINIDARHCPNLATMFAAFAGVKGATVRISGVPQLKFKESDRLETMARVLEPFGARCELHDDGINVFGDPDFTWPEDYVIDCKEDPWVFMSFVLCSTILDRPLTISEDNCAAKIYRNFLRDFETLGGKYEII